MEVSGRSKLDASFAPALSVRGLRPSSGGVVRLTALRFCGSSTSPGNSSVQQRRTTAAAAYVDRALRDVSARGNPL
ncbi:hypothetical protein ACP4OV_013137 [Aristida adscensionis]